MNISGQGLTTQAMEVLSFLSVDGANKGLTMFRQFSRNITYLALFHYPINSRGEISGVPDQALIDMAHTDRVAVLVVLSNFVGTQFNPFVIRTVMQHQEIQERFFTNVITMLNQYQLDGVNLDFENMFPEDRQIFSRFIGRLSAALQAQGKLVTISVPAKLQDDPQAHWRGAFDYAAIGRVVDRVALMTYEEHWAASEPGPVASTPWVNGVLNYAATLISPTKLYVGLPMYGYDWPIDQGQGKTVTYTRAMQLANQHGAAIEWDDVMQAPHFTYVERGITHRVWFENVASVDAKVALARQYGVRGLAVWEMKLTFPEFWRYIATNVSVVKVR